MAGMVAASTNSIFNFNLRCTRRSILAINNKTLNCTKLLPCSFRHVELTFTLRVRPRCASSSCSGDGSSPSASPPGLYSLTHENIDLVLEEVRPYLIADGGNVDVVSVQDGIVSLKLQGACGTCPSSTTTMKIGIERVLKEKFGDAIKDISQVYDDHQLQETTVEAVNRHLDILRPAINNYGGSVQVLSVDAGECLVNYVGPQSIGSGIKAAIKEKFPDIINVVFSV